MTRSAKVGEDVKEMRKYGMSAMALLGALLLGNGQAQASETVNTILGGGVGGRCGSRAGRGSP